MASPWQSRMLSRPALNAHKASCSLDELLTALILEGDDLGLLNWLSIISHIDGLNAWPAAVVPSNTQLLLVAHGAATCAPVIAKTTWPSS